METDRLDDRCWQQYIVRRMSTDLDLARRGEDPIAARQLIRFAADELKRGGVLNPALAAFIRDALLAALDDHAARCDAVERGDPGSGQHPPTVELAAHFGLTYGRRGRPRVKSEYPAEAARHMLELFVCGEKWGPAMAATEKLYDVPSNTLRDWVRVHRPAFMEEVCGELWLRVLAHLQPGDGDREDAIQAAITMAAAELSASSGMAVVRLTSEFRKFRAGLKFAPLSLTRTANPG
jgi:hypothetical protein